ncbi:MAG: hypothetical protein EPN79_15895 [Burkholderiaceae bacterium]|nr:MAG: hypothetical protein EPN79_15895 [Burkholderiaceae bacterium]
MNRNNDFLMPGGDGLFWTQESDLRACLEHAHKVTASDIYFKTGRPVTARVHGRLVRLTTRRLDHEHVQAVTNHLYGGDNGEAELRQGKPLDNAYAFPVGRFESLRYRWCATGVVAERGFGISIVLRELAGIPPALDQADVGPVLMDALFPDDGLVLVCGETGAGKSTLLAGVIRHKAEDPEADCHIVAFEAPVEYVYHGVKTESCEIDQSAVPDHLNSFAAGIRNALRRDPDIILVGESRDAETIKASVLAAQTGHAVYTTVHANSVGTTFLRLIQTLPPESAMQYIGAIIDSIRVIICQRLLPDTAGKRVAVREYLVFDQALRLELMRTASRNLAEVPAVATRLVHAHGRTKSKHAQQLADAGRLEQRYVDALKAEESYEARSIGGSSEEAQHASV